MSSTSASHPSFPERQAEDELARMVPGPSGPQAAGGFSPSPAGGPPLSIGWALIPLLTMGFGTPFSFWYAAARRRSRSLAVASLIYSVLWVVAFVAIEANPGPNRFGALDILGLTVLFGGLWLGGFTHALVVRRLVPIEPSAALDANAQALALAQHRRELREKAREIARRDPALARELRIGRPDLPRQYDDGGLVDVNHAPSAVIATLPGMTPELAARVVALRERQGGYVSVEELMMLADLPPALTAGLAEHTVYLH